MELIDTHCHLTSDAFAGGADAAIDRALAAGVRQMISVGTDLADARAALALARRRSELRMAAGIHPHEAAKATAGDVEELVRLWSDPLCVAVGEIGLDHHYNFSPPDTQRDVFVRQLDLALPTGLPVVIHSREAHADTVTILKRCGYEGQRVLFHCFTGTAEEAAEIAACGWRISFSGVVTFKKSKELQALAAAYPAEHVMLETDSPYLSPEPVRNMRPNEPANVAHVARFLAALRGLAVDEFAALTVRNAREFFSLPQ